MIVEKDSAGLKKQVLEYWDAHPCGTQFTHTEWGTKGFFDETDRFRYATQPFMRELMGFDRFAGKHLLEIGCGLGTDLYQFARGGAHVTGVDLTPRSVELAKARFELAGMPAQLLVADAENLPFEDNSFDVVYSFGVLHHTPNTLKAIDEVHRVLKPGGTIVIMLYHKHSVHVYLGTLFHGLRRGLRQREISVVEDWVRVFDGDGNPLGKAYSRAEAEEMFHKFSNLRLSLCDPIRRRYPKIVNMINQKIFARWFGFWMVIKGEK